MILGNTCSCRYIRCLVLCFLIFRIYCVFRKSNMTFKYNNQIHLIIPPLIQYQNSPQLTSIKYTILPLWLFDDFIISKFYLILLEAQMSTILPSQLEKRFIATSMYKRSRHYFDINKLNQIEVKQEQIRRKPYVETNVSSLDNKFEESFISAQARLNERLQTEVDKHQKRFFRDGDDQTQTSFTFEGRKGKTLDMNKMLSRQYFGKDGRQCKNQSHFCNFKQYQIPNNTIDFTKYTIPRVSKKGKNQVNCNRCKSKQKMNEESNADQLNADITGKIREKLIFDESLFKTVVDYKKYDKQKTQRQQKSSPERKYDQILTGQNMTRKKAKGSLLEFYHGMNKWTSAQMDNRLMRQNQYFIKVYNAKNQQKIDWAILKKKTDLIEKRRNQILKRKNIKDVKGEICDDLYFRRNPLP